MTLSGRLGCNQGPVVCCRLGLRGLLVFMVPVRRAGSFGRNSSRRRQGLFRRRFGANAGEKAGLGWKNSDGCEKSLTLEA
jgi:hypothetical protein